MPGTSKHSHIIVWDYRDTDNLAADPIDSWIYDRVTS